MNISRILIKFLWKDFGAVKIFCTILCLGLIFDIFFKFLVEKPTLTSATKTFFTGRNFPVITLCHHEQIDKPSLESNGFKNFYYYRTGLPLTNGNGTHVKISWNVNGSEGAIEDKIAFLKSAMDCPWNSSFSFEKIRNDFEGNMLERKPLYFHLTRALYPNHRCCKANIKDHYDANIIKAIRIADTTLKPNKNLSSYKIYLSDQISDSPFTLAKKFDLGDEIAITSDETGWHKRYKIKVSQEKHVEGDPKYPCIKYHQHGEYGECLEKEMIKHVKKQLNCTPPWVTDNKVLKKE